MLSHFTNSLQLLEIAQQEKLYKKVVLQLQKDFELANVPIQLSTDISPLQLKTLLHEKVYVLIVENFERYLNLLYVVDISEHEVRNIPLSDAVDVAAEVSFLLLKREWKKVWYRNKYSS